MDSDAKEKLAYAAATVFFGTAIVQFIIPHPLDSLLLPCAAAAWFVTSGQELWVVDEIHARSKPLVASARRSLGFE